MARMARERTLTRTIITTTALVKGNINTTGVETKRFVLEQFSGKDIKTTLKNAYKVKTKKIYCMTEQDFLKYAKVLPPR